MYSAKNLNKEFMGEGNALRSRPRFFIRTFVGKYLIETMIPVLLIIITIFNAIGLMNGPGIIGFAIIFAILVANLALVFISPSSATIHDLVSDTIVVSDNS